MPDAIDDTIETRSFATAEAEHLTMGSSERDAIIEIAAGGAPVKYEMEQATGTLVVDRFLFTPMHHPCNYGFVPRTLSRDGDACDILVVTPIAVLPGAKLKARPIGILLMEDEHGPDEKILAVAGRALTSHYDEVETPDDLPAALLRQIEHFFDHYKDLEPDKWTRVDRWGGPDEAIAILREAHERWCTGGRS